MHKLRTKEWVRIKDCVGAGVLQAENMAHVKNDMAGVFTTHGQFPQGCG